ncbi:diguanylate cyclase domain-containing protein [Paenibacillus sp. TAB 01]|uniref:sensor domain-containing diguanylate cyclase n=1 Tax=Paenibacillus sp. TAB 01 TaxID=3368988 RepID=UPI0037523395
MNDLFTDFLTILLPTYFFFYMAITLYSRNKKSLLNRVAALLMLSFLFYFLGEYIKTSLLPEYQMQIVLYGNGPMLLLMICFLVHLCVLVGRPVTAPMQRWLYPIYAAPFISLIIMLLSKDHRVLFNPNVTDGRSPLDPLFLFLTLLYVAGYILLSVVILTVSWLRTKEAKRRRLLLSLLTGLFGLFAWFMLVTVLLESAFLTSRESMVLYFIGYLLWGISLRNVIGKYDFLPDYRKLFHILFGSAPTAILLLDRKGGVREMNPRAQQLFEGLPSQDIAELPICDETLNLKDKLALFLQDGKKEPHWEVSLSHPRTGPMDLIVGLDLIKEADEELLVMHLTDVTSLKDTKRKLMESERNYKYLAHHDALTGLYNRVAIQERLQQKMAGGQSFALALIDLDNFKQINDTYGHLVGDSYLQHVAGSLRRYAQPDDLIGRIGGDEFIMIIPFADEAIDPYHEAHRRLSPLRSHSFRHNDVELPISFSAGVSLYPKHASDVTSLLNKADEAMYGVKRSGKRGISLFSTNPNKLP